MIYPNIRKAKFIDRPNRFIANIEIDGETQVCHVKNTGRCKELLIPGATIFVQEFFTDTRKTKFDLISVIKGEKLINMDSQAPNQVVFEWLKTGSFLPDITKIQPECKFQNSRFDFYLEYNGKKAFIEVKGVTLEENGVVLFPDAPTQRGVKHIQELIECHKSGYEAWIVFIIQMNDIKYFTPNEKMHQAFAQALKQANENDVNLIAIDCEVTENSIIAGKQVEVRL